MSKKKLSYRVVFLNQGNVYELYAKSVTQADMYGFVEIADITFGERSSVLVDPSDERLKLEFEGVKRTYVPIHSVIRIDQVDREGAARVTPAGEKGASNVAAFPLPISSPGGKDPGPSR